MVVNPTQTCNPLPIFKKYSLLLWKKGTTANFFNNTQRIAQGVEYTHSLIYYIKKEH
jgi:hypothetical protein